VHLHVRAFGVRHGAQDAQSCRTGCGRVTEEVCSELDTGWSAHQSTTVSHDGGRADQPGARMPRCTTTGLRHGAGAVDQSKSRRRKRGSAAFCDDLFVPNQLGWGCCLGLVCLSSALMVRWRSRPSAVVRRRCHAVRHSPLDGQSLARRLSVLAPMVSSARSAS
jgi:hypothetical protein